MATNDAFKNVSAIYEEISPYPPPVPPTAGPARPRPTRELLRDFPYHVSVRIREDQRRWLDSTRFPVGQALRQALDAVMEGWAEKQGAGGSELTPFLEARRQETERQEAYRRYRESAVGKLRPRVEAWPGGLSRPTQLVRLSALVSSIPILRCEPREALLDELLGIPPDGL